MTPPKIQGAKYRVLCKTAYFKEGDEITLVYDDSSHIPRFSGSITDCNNQRWFTPNGEAEEGAPGAVLCKPCSMSTLELIEVPEDLLRKDVAVENEALRYRIKQLEAQLAAKEPLKEGDRVQVELHFLRGTIGYFDITDGVYRVDLDGLSEGEFIWLKPERFTRI